MVTVACVYRTGGIYSREWVRALKRGLERHLRQFRFVCLTDDCAVEQYWRVRMEHAWPGWWSKLELFRPGLFAGPVLYMDLDTLPVGDLSDLAGYRGEFAMISDLLRPARAQSGVMAFTPGPATEAIWKAWMRDPAGHMRRYAGDGQWLHSHTRPERLQDLYPGQIVSLKKHARKGPPEGARLVCGHGRPRLSETKAGWAHDEWRSLAMRAA